LNRCKSNEYLTQGFCAIGDEKTTYELSGLAPVFPNASRSSQRFAFKTKPGLAPIGSSQPETGAS
jgi:hypothetical protein